MLFQATKYKGFAMALTFNRLFTWDISNMQHIQDNLIVLLIWKHSVWGKLK